ncbi:DUF427 domain-containing protein [Halioglobus pacificus]|uniref:DUF427 domain-containing protein n=1 Tax=Parahalioglobus pacificus TaxID=930806 RepID=A0A919CHZ6_9GAMM|nr:DUF427 domain-containing protein [Halioglobus pacificus]GHD27293.1 hypothetical protein GCM10007053_05350 [Halioglobus pacificus]
MWQYHGQQRPAFADEPKPHQESVWDYPRPPALVASDHRVRVMSAHTLIADTGRSVRVLETASPPTIYIPPDDIVMAALTEVAGSSWCEWKGAASYFALTDGDGEVIAWTYIDPTPAFSDLAGYLSFYPGRLHCTVNGETVRAQPGGFYGGWVTDAIAGPFKGEPGTNHW